MTVEAGLGVAVVGCGLIGTRRAETAVAAGDRVVVTADVVADRAATLAGRCGSPAWTADWHEALGRPGVDVVVVDTTNDQLEPVSVVALERGLHVLCEKPMGRTGQEARRIAEAAATTGAGVLKVGFTLRHHAAVRTAWDLVASGGIGEPMLVRSAYGHGGRLGYEKEWRARPEIAGGGELLDQGVHLIDLVGWFLGDLVEVSGRVTTSFWDMAPLEDNAFATLVAAGGATATIHSSWTQWKNLFRFEVIGRDGSVTVDGLGGSYGPERAVVHRRPATFGAPSVEELPVLDPGRAWADEWAELRSAVAESRTPLGSAADGLRAAQVVDAIYQSSSTGRAVAVGVVAPAT